MEFRILGPLEVRRDGRALPIAPRERAALAFLLLHVNEVVSRDELIDRLWGPTPPPRAKASLQNAVSGLRKTLGPAVIETVPPGYRLRALPEEVDALRFEQLVQDARTVDAELRAEKLREALEEWRGAPLSDFPFAEADAVRLEELRLLTLEDRIEADLSLKRHAEVIPELEAIVQEYPLRERFWAQLMLALYRSGRQAEALATYRRAHHVFVGELGIEPGVTLRDLQRAILVQDEALFELHRGPDLIERAAVFLPTTDRGRAEALYDYGLALWRTGERARAKSALLECERRAEALGNRVLVHRARALRASHAVQAGDITSSEFERITAEAVESIRAEGDLGGLADALLSYGYAVRDIGFPDRAVACHEEGIRVAFELSDRWREGFARNFAGFALMLGTTPVEEAIPRCEEHLAALEWGTPGPVGLWMALGMMHTQAGRAEEGRRQLALARDSLRAVAAASTLSTAEYFSAWAATMVADDARAVAHARTSLELLDSLTDVGSRVEPATLLARLEAKAGRLERADPLIASVYATPNADAMFTQVGLKRAIAAVARARGDDKAAQESLEQACVLIARTEMLTLHAETLEDARRLEDALAAFERKGDVTGATRVRQRLENVNA